MANAWVTHLPHFLDEASKIPENLPEPARQVANAMCFFVVYATNFDGEPGEEFPSCFVIVDDSICSGKVFPCLTIDFENIAWKCDTCGSHGIITGWNGTLWDLSDRDELQS